MTTDTALVTGGTRGIGAAIARALAAEGHRVAVTYHGDTEAATRFMDETGIPAFRWDVADPVACREGAARVEAELGPVSVLVNNAGITRDAMFHKMSWEQWRAVLSTDLDSMFAMTRVVIEGMRERRHGRIVNIASVNGQKGQVGQSNYAAAKAGVIGFTKSLALESASRGITVNAIAPGYVDTERVAAVPRAVRESIQAGIPVGRFGLPEEVAHAVCFLVSPKAAFCTGAVLSINGGQYLANG